jgi:hypothetical protein
MEEGVANLKNEVSNEKNNINRKSSLVNINYINSDDLRSNSELSRFISEYSFSGTGKEIFDDLRSNIIAALDLSREQNDEEVCRFIEKEVEEYSRKNLLTLKEREQLEHLLFNSLRKYDAIQELLEDPEVTEIMINGASRIFYEKKGKLFRAQTHFSSEQKLGDVIQQMAGNSNRMVNEASPIVDTRLADGSRVNIVLSPISAQMKNVSAPEIIFLFSHKKYGTLH